MRKITDVLKNFEPTENLMYAQVEEFKINKDKIDLNLFMESPISLTESYMLRSWINENLKKDVRIKVRYDKKQEIEIKDVVSDWENLKKYIAYDIPFGDAMLKNVSISLHDRDILLNTNKELDLFLGGLKLEEILESTLREILGLNIKCRLTCIDANNFKAKEKLEVKEKENTKEIKDNTKNCQVKIESVKEEKEDILVNEPKEKNVVNINIEEKSLKKTDKIFNEKVAKESKKKEIKIDEKGNTSKKIAVAKEAVIKNNMQIDLASGVIKIKRKAKDKEKSEEDDDVKLPKSGLIDGRNQYGSNKVEVYKISEINSMSGRVLIIGEIIEVETLYIEKNNSTLFTFSIYDGTSTINVKKFVNENKLKACEKYIKKGLGVKIYGMAQYDNFSQDLVIMADSIYEEELRPKPKKVDSYPRKRVELRCHTKMSALEGVIDPKDLIKRAEDYEMVGIGITDDAGVQVFPTINNITGKKENFKVLYGVDGFLVNDIEDPIFNLKDQNIKDTTYSFLDIETTGLSYRTDQIIEVGVIKVKDGKEIDRYSTFVNPERPIPKQITDITNINDDMVKDAPTIKKVMREFKDFIGDTVLVAHNADFDIGFLRNKVYEALGESLDNTYLDTLRLARLTIPEIKRYALGRIATFFNIKVDVAHRAVDDVETMIAVTNRIFERIFEKEIFSWKDFTKNYPVDEKAYEAMKTYRITIFAKNQKGLLNLYRLISQSHVYNFYIKARILKSFLNDHLEGLILGSGGISGEVYDMVLSGKSKEEVLEKMKMYDFIEVVPFANAYELYKDGVVKNEKQWEGINKYIISLGESLGKIVVATGDVYLLDKEDKLYREIIQTGKKQRNAHIQPDVYFRTTTEMMDEFSYLGKDKAEEIVINNSLKVLEMCDKVNPISPVKCPPTIEGSDKQLTDLVMTKAKRIYGENLPEIIKKRIDTELTSIISNEFAVLYILAHKLVKKSNDDGYMVGSRGSVGSSLVAFMANISEINSLPPHYVCPNCKYSEFTDIAANGYDLPDKDCPKCGEKLNKDGMNIPFETFLGFSGDKEPDIDLNFSSEYQAVAHNYTLELIGDGKTYKAGTIGTIADKTAFGYTKHFFDEKGIHVNKPEIARISKGCIDVKASTGQHPGGIVVLPAGHEINEFTPVQRPADKMDIDIITTHFDYHSIEHNLLKLDILGHDNPTILRMFEDQTGVSAKSIPMDDKKTMSLFSSDEALNIKKDKYPNPFEKIKNDVGTKGIPEFGTMFVQDMLRKTKPTTFDELLRISGLSHGTDVWRGNAESLIDDGICTLKEAICTRDDIMVYLMKMGLPPASSFKIMEAVRKGRGLTPEWEELMREKNVPDWYIASCKKIKYMFPKAHAAAYVTASFQIAWYKINYPAYYYAIFFSVKGKDFDGFLMSGSYDEILTNYKNIISKPKLSDVEKNMLTIFDLVIEMYRREITFLPIDLYKSHYKNFVVEEDGRIRMPFSALPGLGEKASKNIYDAAQELIKKGEKFKTRDEIRQKCKIGDSIMDMLDESGSLGNLPNSEQISFFDF